MKSDKEKHLQGSFRKGSKRAKAAIAISTHLSVAHTERRLRKCKKVKL